MVGRLSGCCYPYLAVGLIRNLSRSWRCKVGFSYGNRLCWPLRGGQNEASLFKRIGLGISALGFDFVSGSGLGKVHLRRPGLGLGVTDGSSGVSSLQMCCLVLILWCARLVSVSDLLRSDLKRSGQRSTSETQPALTIVTSSRSGKAYFLVLFVMPISWRHYCSISFYGLCWNERAFLLSSYVGVKSSDRCGWGLGLNRT